LSLGFDEGTSLFHKCGSETVFSGGGKSPVRRYPTDKNLSGVRIFTIGASVSVEPVNGNYSVYLENALRRQSDSNSYYVINAAVGGYGTSRLLIVLRQILQSDEKPDLIILHPHGSNEFEDEVQLDYLNDLKRKWHNQLLFKSEFFLLMKRLNQLIVPNILVEQRAEDEIEAGKDQEQQAQWQRAFNKNLAEMCEIINAAEVPTILILRAVNPSWSENNTFTNTQTQHINANTHRAIKACNNIYIFDTPVVMEQLYPNPTVDTVNSLFVDSSHWQVKTHKAIAARLLEFIDANELLSPVETNNIDISQR
jgi:hypothetical protein